VSGDKCLLSGRSKNTKKNIVTATHHISRGADVSFIYPQEHGWKALTPENQVLIPEDRPVSSSWHVVLKSTHTYVGASNNKHGKWLRHQNPTHRHVASKDRGPVTVPFCFT